MIEYGRSRSVTMAQANAQDVSLIALTSHFAQVQFRLKQITSAPLNQREALLRQLEEFAFQGCPVSLLEGTDGQEEELSLDFQRQQLQECIDKLSVQLQQMSETTPTSSVSVHKQRVIMDEMAKRFKLQFGNVEELSETEVREQVGRMVESAQQPAISKDTVVKQLSSQVRIMEQHIAQLQEELYSARTPFKPHPVGGASVPVGLESEVNWFEDAARQNTLPVSESSDESVVAEVAVEGDRWRATRLRKQQDERYQLEPLNRILSLMQVLTLWQCGGAFQCLPEPVKDRNKDHFHRSLHDLEMAVDKVSVITTALSQRSMDRLTRARLEGELHEAVSMSMSDALQQLLQHGWVGLESSSSSRAFCFSPRSWWGVESPGWNPLISGGSKKECTGWLLLRHFYRLKKGPLICTKPEMKLSSSFCLPMDASSSIRKTLLQTIHNAENTFTGNVRALADTKFRAFVCQGFNLQHLGDWLRLVIGHPGLVEEMYRPSAFVATTGFRPALHCLDRLKDTPSVAAVQLPTSYYHHINASTLK